MIDICPTSLCEVKFLAAMHTRENMAEKKPRPRWLLSSVNSYEFWKTHHSIITQKVAKGKEWSGVFPFVNNYYACVIVII